MRIQPWKSLVEPRPDVGSTSPEYGVKRGMQLSHSGVRTCGHRSLLVVAREIISALSIVGPASFNTMLSGVEPVPPSGGQLEHRRMRRVAGGRLTASQADDVGIPESPSAKVRTPEVAAVRAALTAVRGPLGVGSVARLVLRLPLRSLTPFQMR